MSRYNPCHQPKGFQIQWLSHISIFLYLPLKIEPALPVDLLCVAMHRPAAIFYLFEQQRYRMICHVPIYFPDTCNSWGWAGAWNSIKDFEGVSRNPPAGSQGAGSALGRAWILGAPTRQAGIPKDGLTSCISTCTPERFLGFLWAVQVLGRGVDSTMAGFKDNWDPARGA